MIDPKYSECMQRGYLVKGDSCQFPDGTKCELEEFNTGACGIEWMTEDYCIPEGEYVWDKGKCCDGLVAYLPAGADGQATCQPMMQPAGNLLKNPITWSIGLVGIALMVFAWKKLLGRK